MAELTDDFGSDAEDYEDALEELKAEERKEVTTANIITPSDLNKSSPSTENNTTERLSEANGNIDANVQSPSQTNASAKDTKDYKDGSENSTSDSEDEEEEESVNRNKAYCDIPADPKEEEEKDYEALHEQLNEQIDKDEDDIDEEEKVQDVYFVDEEKMKELEANMTDEEKVAKKDEAQLMKGEGNEQFKAGEYVTAMDTYTNALKTCPLCFAKERAIMYSNRGACRYKRELYDSCAGDCTKALELHPRYVKALLRRAECYEKTDKLEQALEDYQQLLEIDPSLGQAREACMRLPDQIKEKNEKLKEEMMGKLKDLGNMVLRPFGLSTNNFNLVQNPDTGSYSVNFNNNGS